MQKLIDLKSHEVDLVLNVLLKDRTTEQNIIFATDMRIRDLHLKRCL